LTVLGVDPFSEAPFRSYVRGGQTGAVEALLAEPGTVLLPDSTARLLGVGVGDSFEVVVGGLTRRLRVVALVTPPDERPARALEGLVLLDVSTAQALLGRTGRLSRIDLKLGSEAELERLREWLPPGAEVVRPSARG